MASTEYIRKRLDGANAKLEKLNKKMTRILAAQATEWEVNPYYYNKYDLVSTEKEIKQVKASIAKYTADLSASIEKDNSRNVEAILTFLEGWKARMTKFYADRLAAYPEAREQYWEDIKFWSDLGYFKQRKLSRENPELYKELKDKADRIKAEFEAAFGMLDHYIVNGATFEWDRFNRDIENEANRKYDFIIERTNAIVGTITDASNLKVGSKGDLNGYIIGTKGTAKVQTIGAGGYNIQCYHFRTLVNRMK